MQPLSRTLALTAAVLVALPCAAADWPQWRGPNRDGKSSETGLLKSWPAGGPALEWKIQGIGAGYSSVSVSKGRIFTMGDLADGQYAFALKEDGGELIWKSRVGVIHEDKRGGPRCTPTVDGDRVFVETTEGEVVALDTETGKEVWRRNLPEDFGGYLMKAMGSYDWKFSESPLVDGDRVIVTPGHVQAVMVALNRETGEEIWRTAGRRLGPRGADGAGYSSPIVFEADEIRQYVQLVGRGLIGVDAATGRLLWGYNEVAGDIANISTPVIDGQRIFSSTGYGTGAALVEVGRSGDEWAAEEIYFLPADTFQNHHGGLILHDGVIFAGTGHNKGFPIAVAFGSGEVAWGPVRNEGTGTAAVTYADGRIYFRYQNGRMILVEPSPREYRERGSFMIPDVVKESWARPVVANGKLLLREQDTLYSYDVTGG
jgi:outer membrane protein assembly factor BamB